VEERVPDVGASAATLPIGETDVAANSYVVPSFLPTPPLTPRIQNEYFRYDIEGFLQCSKCEFRAQSATTDGPGARKALLEHVYTTHIENLPWTCKDCQFTTKFKSNLIRHCRKLDHVANEEPHAPPGVREPDTRVIAASAKRVKWAGVNLSKTESSLTSSAEDDESAVEHGYSIPTITPAQRLAWRDQSSEQAGSMDPGTSEQSGEQTVRLQWTGQSVEPITSASAIPSPLPSSSRKRKSTQRVLTDDDDAAALNLAEKRVSSTSTAKKASIAVSTATSPPDSRLTPEALCEKYVKSVEDDAGARCAICDFVIRKTPRVNDPRTLMLSHVCGHLALSLRITCIACGYATENATHWETHKSESELDGGPLAAHEPSFAVTLEST